MSTYATDLEHMSQEELEAYEQWLSEQPEDYQS